MAEGGLADPSDSLRRWISKDRVVLVKRPVWIDVQRGKRVLTAWRFGRVARRFRIVIGTSKNSTPQGLAAVYERNQQPDPQAFLGPWSLPLTALSHTLRNYGGGIGRIALHGRDAESLADPLGSAASHGCIRTLNSGIRWLAQYAAPGTPVLLRN